jgi:phosphoglycolate phosphatase
MLKHIIFDLDGTLVDSLGTFVKIGNELAPKYGYKPLDDNRIRELMRLPIRQRIDLLGVPFFKIPKVGLEALEMFNAYAAKLVPIEGVGDLLLSLSRKGYTLSIISSNSLPNIKAFLNANNLEKFDNILSSKNLFGKHITINKLISSLRLNKNEIIYVGDEQRDIEACHKIGLRIIAVTWGFDPPELLREHKPDYLADKPSDIEIILEEINADIKKGS